MSVYTLTYITCFHSKHNTQEVKVIVKEVGATIPPSSGHTVTTLITIPPPMGPSILNCRVIKSEYKVKVNVFLLPKLHCNTRGLIMKENTADVITTGG